jgi:hypothetical protein
VKLVRIKSEFCSCEAEHQAVYAVVEDNGDRCMISPVNCTLPIVPIETVPTGTLENHIKEIKP